MTTQNNDVAVLKAQVFKLSDELYYLYKAYQGVQLMACTSSCEAEHVGSVIDVLNYRFESLLDGMEALYKRDI